MAEKVETFLTQFDDNPQALEKLAYFSATAGQRTLSERLYQIALDKDLNKSHYLLLLLEVDIRAGNYTDAAELIQAIKDEDPPWLEKEGRIGLFHGFDAVVHYALGDEEQGEYIFNQLFQTSSRPIKEQIAVAKHCQRINRADKAYLLFNHIHPFYPKNEEIIYGLLDTQLDLEITDNLTQYVSKALATRQPPIDLLEDAYATLASDRFLFIENREPLLDQLERRIKGSPYSEGTQ